MAGKKWHVQELMPLHDVAQMEEILEIDERHLNPLEPGFCLDENPSKPFRVEDRG